MKSFLSAFAAVLLCSCSGSVGSPSGAATPADTGPGTAVVTVSIAGTGLGIVSGGAIDCDATCSASIVTGTSVTLTATASEGSTFAGWSGAGCSGTGTCTVAVAAAETVTATFNIAQETGNGTTGGATSGPTSCDAGSYLLKVSMSGIGSIDGSGIACGAICSACIPAGTSVALNAAPGGGEGAYLVGWSGACSGPNANCTFVMNADTTVSAVFDVEPNVGCAAPSSGK